jgi:hypothetical protein
VSATVIETKAKVLTMRPRPSWKKKQARARIVEQASGKRLTAGQAGPGVSMLSAQACAKRI